MSRSTLVTCAVVVAPRAGRALVARSSPSGSTPPLIWCRRGFRLPRPRGGVDPLGELLATSARPARGATTTAHVTNVLRDMSRAPCDTPRSLHSAVAQRHLETEVANCVGGVRAPP